MGDNQKSAGDTEVCERIPKCTNGIPVCNVDRDYIVLLSNLIEEGTVQCIVEKLDLATLLVRTGTP